MSKITGVYVGVDREPEVISIDNRLSSFQNIIGGWMEVVQISKDILMLVNEEGMLSDLPVNFALDMHGNRQNIHGNVFFVSALGVDFHSLDKIQSLSIITLFEADRNILVAGE